MSVSLEFLQARVKELEADNFKLSVSIHCAKDRAFELLDALKGKRQDHSPATNEEVIRLIGSIIDELSD